MARFGRALLVPITEQTQFRAATKRTVAGGMALIFVGIVISYIDRGNLSLATAPIMRDMALGAKQMGVLLSAFFWTYAIFQLPAGFLIDRYGLRVPYAIAFTVWSLASAGIALSRGPGDIVAMRMLLGMAEAIGPIASTSFIRRYFSRERRGLPTALYIGGQTLGPAIGTLLGTAIMLQGGWRMLFALTGICAVFWVPLWLYVAPREYVIERQTGSYRMSNIAIVAMSGCAFFSSYFWWFVMTWMPGYLTMARGYSAAQMGRVFSIPLFAMTATNLGGGWLADRIVRRRGNAIGIRVGFGCAGLVLASGLLLLNFSAKQGIVLPVLIVCICGFGLASSNMWAIAQTLASAQGVGRFIGYLNTLSQIAGAAAPLATGWILAVHHDFRAAIWIAGCSPILAAVSLVWVRQKQPEVLLAAR